MCTSHPVVTSSNTAIENLKIYSEITAATISIGKIILKST
jgi:hypothetical protein